MRLLSSSAATPRAAGIAASALAAGDEGDVEESGREERPFSSVDDDDDDEEEELGIATSSSTPADVVVAATSAATAATPNPTTDSLFRAPADDPLRPWEADLPTIDQVLRDPDWPLRVASWPKFWALYGLWRHHLLRREQLPPATKEEKRNPRARRSALWERALRLAPPDGAEETNILFADGVWDDGSEDEGDRGERGEGGEGGGGGGDDGGNASSSSSDSAAAAAATASSNEDEEGAYFNALYARAQAREAARLAALPSMPSSDQRKWREEADERDAQIFEAVCAVHRALPGLLAAKAPVPEHLEAADPWKAYWNPELEGIEVEWKLTRDPTVLPTYRTGGVVGGTAAFPGPRASSGLQRASRTEIAKMGADASRRGDPTGSRFSRADAEEEELAARRSAFADGVVQHDWARWGDVELRAWNEKRRAHARADAAFAVKQAEVGKNKCYNVDELTDLRLAKKVVGLMPRFKLVWTHEEIMGVITNGGQNVHPDLAAPALGVGDPARNLDYWEEGIHAPSDIVAELAANGRIADDESGLPDLGELFGESEFGGEGGEGGEGEGEGEGGDGGEGGGGAEAGVGGGVPAAAAAAALAAAKASSEASAPMLPFPTAAAASADLAETFAGLDEMGGAGGVSGGGGAGSEEEEEEDDEIVIDDDDDEDGSDNDIGGMPGIDVDPEFDEDSV